MTPTVLLVEDDRDQLGVRALLLEREGYAVLTAADADAALGQMETRPPGVVVMDLRLPKIEDGLRLISGIGARAPVIVLTGGRVSDLPVVRVLKKPCRSRVLLDAIAEVLSGA